MPKYECVSIIRTDIAEDQIQATVDYVRQNYEQRLKAEILKTDEWGKRRLAYEIDKHRDGYYVLLEMMLDAKGVEIEEVKRRIKTNDNIIRSVLVRIPPIADKQKERAARRAQFEAERARQQAEEEQRELARAEAEAEAEAGEETETTPELGESTPPEDKPQSAPAGESESQPTETNSDESERSSEAEATAGADESKKE